MDETSGGAGLEEKWGGRGADTLLFAEAGDPGLLATADRFRGFRPRHDKIDRVDGARSFWPAGTFCSDVAYSGYRARHWPIAAFSRRASLRNADSLARSARRLIGCLSYIGSPSSAVQR